MSKTETQIFYFFPKGESNSRNKISAVKCGYSGVGTIKVRAVPFKNSKIILEVYLPDQLWMLEAKLIRLRKKMQHLHFHDHGSNGMLHLALSFWLILSSFVKMMNTHCIRLMKSFAMNQNSKLHCV